jgi:hypothetical protein
MLFTSQVTFVVGAPVTVEVNVVCPAGATVAEVGLTVTWGGARMVTIALPEAVLSSDETAVTVTVAGEGTCAGAK